MGIVLGGSVFLIFLKAEVFYKPFGISSSKSPESPNLF
jgi:hypothetical protein